MPIGGRRIAHSALAAVVLAFGLVVHGVPARADDLLVFAAASLRNAIDDVDAKFEQDRHHKVTASYAASSVLAKQIAAAAPADVYISANIGWMDYLAKRNLIKPASRVALLGNGLVLIAPKDSKITAHIAPHFDLAALLGGGNLAMGDPDHVPAGIYGKAALQSLGVWQSVKAKVARAQNVRAALLLVARGEVPLGIVYTTDAAVEPKVRVVGTFPADTHPPIRYPVAITAMSKNPLAKSYIAYLQSAAARAIFEKYGFTVLGAPPVTN